MINWKQLEKKYSIMVEGNKATASKRRRVLDDKRLFTATAIVGTKAVDVVMDSQNGVPGPIFDLEVAETLTDSNVESELKQICMFVLADYEAAQKAVIAEHCEVKRECQRNE
jgi:hypothetical protein